MGDGDNERSGAADPEASGELPTEVVETQLLIDDDRHTTGHSSSLREGQNRRLSSKGCSESITPCLIVLLALFGVGFFFVDRPRPSDWATDELTLPPGAENVVAPTILISIDGFRHEYLSRKKKDKDGSESLLAPNLNLIATTGVYATDGMQPVVPTVTFPNHWSLVTGLYPENSGIVGNTMFDPIKKSWFHLDRVNPDWWFGAPIWQTVRQTPRVVLYANGTRATLNQNYTSACVFWPGSDVPKHAPNAFWKYDSSISYKARVDRAIALIGGTAADLNGRAQLTTLYFDKVDHAGHQHGPNSDQVTDEIVKVDNAIGYLLSSLGKNASQVYNVVVVSDHGMTEISEDRTIDLAQSVKQGTAQDIVTSPMGLFLNMTISAEELYANIKEGLKGHSEHAAVYLKEELPERWHLRESRLITRVVTMATLGWTVKYPHQHLVPDTDKPLERLTRAADKPPLRQKWPLDKGSHGYDNTFEDMQALFLAQGPAFRPGSTLKKMRTIDVYEMLCHIFSAKPSPNNGTLVTTLSTILKADTIS